MVKTSSFDGVFGNESIKKAFFGFTERNAFPSSIIISGKKGSGKHTLATLASMAIACKSENKPCLECEACRKISLGISPDVVTVSAQKDRKTIGIEVVRGIRELAYISPNDLDVKIYIIDAADTMTEQAQNALLKLFEEPPKNVYFFLLCTSASGLLTTVRSRAPELRTELFGDEKMTSLLLKNSRSAEELYKKDRENFNRILKLSGGSYGTALSLIDSSDKKLFSGMNSANEILSTLSGGVRADFLVLLLKEAKCGRDNLIKLFELMLAAIRDMVAAKKLRENFELLFYPDFSSAKASAARHSLKTLIEMAEELERARAQLSDINVNLQTAATVFADRLWSYK